MRNQTQEMIIVSRATAKQLGSAMLNMVADLKRLAREADEADNHSMAAMWRGRLEQAEAALADYSAAYCDSRNNTMTKKG